MLLYGKSSQRGMGTAAHGPSLQRPLRRASGLRVRFGYEIRSMSPEAKLSNAAFFSIFEWGCTHYVQPEAPKIAFPSAFAVSRSKSNLLPSHFR